MYNKHGLGKIIHDLRSKSTFSQEHLARELGVSRTAISQMESGERGVSSVELRRLAEIFAVSADFLLGLETETMVVLEQPKSYGKTRSTPPVRISVPQKKVEKFKQVLLYLLERCAGKPNVGETVVYKLLYFADFNFYEIFEEQLTGATYRKLPFGPVPLEFAKIIMQMEKNKELTSVQSDYYEYSQKRYIPLVKPNLQLLTAAEKSVLDSVIDRFSDKSARWLSDYSHEDIPWKATAEKQIIDYELVFYRSPAYSVRDSNLGER